MNILTSNRILAIFLAVIVLIFGGIRLYDLRNLTYVGFSTDANRVVTEVRAGSPAEAAGLKTGDRLLKVGDIAVSDVKANARRPRPAVGESREFVVERSGQEETLTVTYAVLPDRQMMVDMAGVVTGLCFLVLGLWPYLKKQNPLTELFAAVGICFGFLSIGPPYFEAYAIRATLAVLFFPVVILGIAALLHFVLVFPRAKGWIEKKNSTAMLYAPPVLIAAYLIFLILWQPEATPTINRFNQILFGLFFVVYLGMTIIVMVRTFLKASASERSEYGLNIMAAGAVLALIMPVIETVTGIISPATVLPGSDFYGLGFILLPLTFSYAVIKTLGPAAGEEEPAESSESAGQEEAEEPAYADEPEAEAAPSETAGGDEEAPSGESPESYSGPAEGGGEEE